MVKKGKDTEDVQPLVNVALVGHVDHGKTTLLERISGKWTDSHSEELKRGITIKLGYADITIYKTKDGIYTTKKTDDSEKLRTISFVDAPGHETLMATMLSGSAIVDGALLLVAANEECPQPQTREHLTALEILGIKNIIIIQNKIDLVSRDDALNNYNKIKEFTKGSVAENAPVIPVSAKHNININYIIEAIETFVPTPERDLNKDPILYVARSFDINKPGSDVMKLHGGVLGGAIKEGVFKVNDNIEIRPGRLIHDKGVSKWISIKTNILSLVTGGVSVESVKPGGSIAMQTNLDPAIVKGDQLAGSVVGLVDKLPGVYEELILETYLLKHVIGSKEELKVEPIKKTEALMLNVNAMTTAGIVTSLEKKGIKVKLRRPVCAAPGSKMAISRRIGNRWHLVGWALIRNK
ncbi:MAG TPA: translation initiation factor IF-2 subunit gamma [Candidatus Nanoarchaeia archaeon]|nr:translation initiation factor IF-2 subunit gamma [Candidatus Nanoarchaeia archaeon]